MSDDTQKVCFVVMGFGKKTDYESGRTLDLDATYEAIIQPAAVNNTLRCIRADEMMHSGIIDTAMYEMLLRADLVVADISTGNVNAIYELGVRHALRPNSTIIMKEAAGRLYFDLNHINTFQYEHLGQDIGQREASRACSALSRLIEQVMAAQIPDSPVYAFLPKLQQPRLSNEEYAELLDETEAAQERLSGYMQAGEIAIKASRFLEATEAFKAASSIKPDDSFILQQFALATYKSRMPSPLEALMRAREIINELRPEHSNDPETLGIHGAIRKRLWDLSKDRVQIDAAIDSYGRGFQFRRDYYNGENLALCLDLRAAQQSDPAEATYDHMSAHKVRVAVHSITKTIMEAPTFDDRSDRRWVVATRANMAFALDLTDEAEHHERVFLDGHPSPAEWEIETYKAGKLATLQALGKTPGTSPNTELGSLPLD